MIFLCQYLNRLLNY